MRAKVAYVSVDPQTLRRGNSEVKSGEETVVAYFKLLFRK